MSARVAFGVLLLVDLIAAGYLLRWELSPAWAFIVLLVAGPSIVHFCATGRVTPRSLASPSLLQDLRTILFLVSLTILVAIAMIILFFATCTQIALTLGRPLQPDYSAWGIVLAIATGITAAGLAAFWLIRSTVSENRANDDGSRPG